MPCHQWLQCVTDKHLQVGDRSVSRKREPDAGSLHYCNFHGMIHRSFGREKKRGCGQKEFRRYRALLGVCDLKYSAFGREVLFSAAEGMLYIS